MSNKTDLKRDILIELQNNPGATNAEIADSVGCSSSYVSQVKNEFDDYDSIQAGIDALDRDLDESFDQMEDDLDDLGL